MMLDYAIELWISQEGYCEVYASYLRKVLTRDLGCIVSDLAIDKITTAHLKNAIKLQEQRGLSQYTITVFCQVIGRFFSFLEKNGHIEHNPYSKEINPKALPNRFAYYTIDEEMRINRAIPYLPQKELYQFCLDTGIRSNNVRALLQKDVNLTEGTITVSKIIVGYPEVIKSLPSPFIYKASTSVLEKITHLMNGGLYLFPGDDNGFVCKSEMISNNAMLKMLTGIPDISLYKLSLHTSHKRRDAQ